MYSAATQINDTSDLESAIHTVESDLNLLEERVEDNENSIGELDHAKNVAGKITIDNDDTLVTDGTIKADRLETKYIYSSENSITSPSYASLGYLESTNNGYLFLDSHSTNANIRSTGIYLRSSTTEGVQTFWRIEAHGNTGNLRIYDQLYGRTMMQIRDGNMGIEVSSPTAKLDVNGDIRSRDNIRMWTSQSGWRGLYLARSDGSSNWSMRTDNTARLTIADHKNNRTVMSLHPDGSVGIGIGQDTPTAGLDVGGDVRVRGNLIVEGTYPGGGGLDGFSPVLIRNVYLHKEPGETRGNIKLNFINTNPGEGGDLHEIIDDEETPETIHDLMEWFSDTIYDYTGKRVLYNINETTRRVTLYNLIGMGNYIMFQRTPLLTWLGGQEGMEEFTLGYVDNYTFPNEYKDPMYRLAEVEADELRLK